MSGAMAEVCEERGYRVALTDVYSDDWLIPDPLFHSRVIDGAVCDGSIMLLHVPDRPGRLQTLEILQGSIERLRARGFQFLRLSDLFRTQGEGGADCPSCVLALVCALVSLICLLVALVLSALRLPLRLLGHCWSRRAPCITSTAPESAPYGVLEESPRKVARKVAGSSDAASTAVTELQTLSSVTELRT
mmetsp:Transcript_55076/g.128229  ORF Transcript_55076/g.128229 Transcript_55076/m.128229 type:complete len:190 (+) Transcript_55076:690-1259(+)